MIVRRSRLLSCLKENEIAPYTTSFPLLGTNHQFWTHVNATTESNVNAGLLNFSSNALSESVNVNPFPTSDVSPYANSKYVPDLVINPHPRFATLVNNIRTRRGSNVDIRMPLFEDVNTPEFMQNPSAAAASAGVDARCLEVDTDIHMDCMAFGMGMNSLQVTFQGGDIDESRYMYDQLAVLAPIMLAVTAATPIFKGRLSDVDARWNAIGQSVDCRTPAERGLVDNAVPDIELAGGGVRRLQKSRYASISTYIYHCNGDAKCTRSLKKYNDIPCPVDEPTKARLLDAGLDENLAHHVAHLFTRDPLVIFDGDVEQDDEKSTDHFENIQSTNWQTCRWKPPPPRLLDDPHIGWRTEFRSMEIQLTDFENAAYAVFIALITRVLLAFDLKLYIPLSRVDCNMERAHKRDAINTQRFYFRKFIAPFDPSFVKKIQQGQEEAELEVNATASMANMAVAATAAAAATASGNQRGAPCNGSSPDQHSSGNSDTSTTPVKSPCTSGPCGGSDDLDDSPELGPGDAFEEMTLDEIFHGKCVYYPGLIPLIYGYLEYIDCPSDTFAKLHNYLTYISRKVSGETMTTAMWIRKFVTTHPKYKHDSFVSEEIQYDLLVACHEIGNGTRACPEILGADVKIEKINIKDAWGHHLKGKLNAEERSELMTRMIQRALKRQKIAEESNVTSASVVRGINPLYSTMSRNTSSVNLNTLSQADVNASPSDDNSKYITAEPTRNRSLSLGRYHLE